MHLVNTLFSCFDYAPITRSSGPSAKVIPATDLITNYDKLTSHMSTDASTGTSTSVSSLHARLRKRQTYRDSELFGTQLRVSKRWDLLEATHGAERLPILEHSKKKNH